MILDINWRLELNRDEDYEDDMWINVYFFIDDGGIREESILYFWDSHPSNSEIYKDGFMVKESLDLNSLWEYLIYKHYDEIKDAAKALIVKEIL